MARIASTVLVVALLAATAAAFALTEGLKLQLSPITGTSLDRKAISPVCRCASARASVRFRLRERDVVDAVMIDGSGTAIATLTRGQAEPAGRVVLTWDGRDGAGRVVPEGEYRPRVHLREAQFTIEMPNPIRVDVTPPEVEGATVARRVFSPDGDRRRDRVPVAYRFAEEAKALLFVDGRRHTRTRFASEAGRLAWNGRLDGRLLSGTHRLAVAAEDAAGNVSERTALGAVRIRYVALGRSVVRVTAGTRFAIRVSADAPVRWRLGARSGTSAPGTLRLRAPTQKGRFTLSVSVGERVARAAVLVRERP